MRPLRLDTSVLPLDYGSAIYLRHGEVLSGHNKRIKLTMNHPLAHVMTLSAFMELFV